MTTKSATKKCEVSQKVRLKSVNVQEMFPRGSAIALDRALTKTLLHKPFVKALPTQYLHF
mgnify:CR=1 FL=1